jgi:hypothetical protein
LPVVFVDLHEAVSIARKRGTQGAVDRARLQVWSPGGAPPVLAWMIRDKTINGATGEIIDFDVTGYIKSYNAQWEHAAKGLRDLIRGVQPGATTGTLPLLDPSAEAVRAWCIGRPLGTPAFNGMKCGE